jgi:hypothetical protein
MLKNEADLNEVLRERLQLESDPQERRRLSNLLHRIGGEPFADATKANQESRRLYRAFKNRKG